jgi:cytochrome c553
MVAIMLMVAKVTWAESNDIVACVACHGENGQAVEEHIPNLSGQKADYMISQLNKFRDGSRSDPDMSLIAQDLSDVQIEALAQYYAQQPPYRRETDENENLAGKNVSAYCISCHGIKGKTVNQEWPDLAGQNKEYLMKQLRALRDGSHLAPPMNDIAKKLTDQQITDVAEYYSQKTP